VLSYRPAQARQPDALVLNTIPEESMARSCAICGKVSMAGFNPQSSGSNRVRAHRRMQPNLQPLVIERHGSPVKALVCTRCRRTLLKASR
jgi:ribosomal protein L28